MTWSYFVAFDDAIDRDELLGVLDSSSYVLNWYSPLSHGVVVVTDRTALQIGAVIKGAFPGRKFVVLDVDTDRAGWLPRSAWDMMRGPGA